MKLKEFLNWIQRKVGKTEKQAREIDHEDPYATIKRRTKTFYLGGRFMRKHNNRKMTRGRRIQYITDGKCGKPIFHGAK